MKEGYLTRILANLRQRGGVLYNYIYLFMTRNLLVVLLEYFIH